MPVMTPTGTYTFDQCFDPDKLLDEVYEEVGLK
jgi:hypothetical protein